MGEPQKGTSSINPKEKKSFLDDDIGKDFLGSWKSMSVAEDDTMDFSFNTISSGKKNAFNFEKLDMDFNLDGDFDKLSSFKVDMSDFDFSAPSKKAAKPKERSEGESSTGNPKGKKDQFSFSFDFNELDSFNFESSLAKEEKSSSKKQDDKMEVSSDGAECRGSKLQLDAIATKLPASEEVAASSSETLLCSPKHLNSMKNDQEKYVSSGAPTFSSSGRSSQDKAISTERLDQQIHLSEKAISKEVYSQQALPEFPGQSFNGVDSSRDAVTDGKTESCQWGTGAQTTSNKKEDVKDKVMAGASSYHEDSPPNNSSPPHITTSGDNKGGKNKSGCDTSPKYRDGKESAEGDLDLEGNSTSTTSTTNNNKEDCSSRSELPAAHVCSEPVVDKVTLTNEYKAGGPQSKFSKREGTAHLIRQSSSLETKFLSSGIERTGPSHKNPAIETEEDSSSNDKQTGMELRCNPVSVAKELTKVKDVLPMGEKNVNNLYNIREGFTSDGLPNGFKMVGKSRLQDEAPRRISIIPSIDRNVKDQNTLALQVPSSSSLESQGKFSVQTCANSKLFVPSMESLQNSKAKPIEGNKLSFVRAAKKMPDLATMKVLKTTVAADKVSSDSTPQKDTGSLQNSEKNVEVEGSTASETSYPINSNETKSPMNLPLKRKTFEISNSDLSSLKPIKRLSESLTKSRDFKEPLKRAVEEKFSTAGKNLTPLKCLPETASESRHVKEPLKRIDVKDSFKRIDGEKVCIDKNQVESKTQSIFYNVPASASNSPQQINMMEFEISSVMENDGNVEKAEAYAKELEDICNMLKKKHEEAKEILVRAIVNNNNLLMLNHPIYEEKLCKVQKFAAELMSKELKA